MKNYINTHRCIPLVNFSDLECVCIKYTFCYLPFKNYYDILNTSLCSYMSIHFLTSLLLVA